MQFIFIYFILILITPPEPPSKDVFFVTRVVGQVELLKENRPLKVGSEISAGAKIKFKTKGSKLFAVNAYGKIFQTKVSKEVNEISLVIDAMLPVTKVAATKDVRFPNRENLKLFFAALDSLDQKNNGQQSRPFFIIDSLNYTINFDSLSPSRGVKYFLRFRQDDMEYERQIPSKEKDIYISPKLFSVKGEIPPYEQPLKCQIFTQNPGEELIFFSEFQPLFADTARLRQEMAIIIEYRNREISEREFYIYDLIPYIKASYGYVYRKNLREWINKNFDLSY